MSIATPFEGPSPGRAPIIVPKIQPTTAKPRQVGVKATENPKAKFENKSMLFTPYNHLGKANKPRPSPYLKIINKTTESPTPIATDSILRGLI